MTDAPETIWAFCTPDDFDDDATITAYETIQHGGQQYRRADLPATDAQALANEKDAYERGFADALEKAAGFSQLAADHAEWSQATFGNDSERDHKGPLAHLRKEIAEIEAAPHDGSEWADGFLLLLDASRRAGFPASVLVQEATAKLKINKGREWGKPNEDGSVEHIRALQPDTKGQDT
jgi:hypothetical protein